MGQACEQRRRLPKRRIAAGLRRDVLEGARDDVQTRLVREEHGAAAKAWETIAVEIDQVDVRSALRDAVLEDAGAFVDQRVDAAVDDFLRAHAARRDAFFPGVLFDDGGNFGLRNRMPRTGFEPAPTG